MQNRVHMWQVMQVIATSILVVPVNCSSIFCEKSQSQQFGMAFILIDCSIHGLKELLLALSYVIMVSPIPGACGMQAVPVQLIVSGPEVE